MGSSLAALVSIVAAADSEARGSLRCSLSDAWGCFKLRVHVRGPCLEDPFSDLFIF